MDPVAEFAALVDRPGHEVDLGRAALAFAAVADRGLLVPRWLGELDRLAAGVRDFAGLRRRLFDEEGFTGAASPTIPDHSMLQHVLRRRRGLPISLSAIMIDVGRRAGVAVDGIGMPFHFIVRDPASGRYCDPYHGGALLDEGDCEALVRRIAGARVQLLFGPDSLPVVDAHQILVRMLDNLVHLYRELGRSADLEWAARCQAAIPGQRPRSVLVLAESLARQGRFQEAASELEAAAGAAEPAQAERLTRAAHSLRASLN